MSIRTNVPTAGNQNIQSKCQIYLHHPPTLNIAEIKLPVKLCQMCHTYYLLLLVNRPLLVGQNAMRVNGVSGQWLRLGPAVAADLDGSLSAALIDISSRGKLPPCVAELCTRPADTQPCPASFLRFFLFLIAFRATPGTKGGKKIESLSFAHLCQDPLQHKHSFNNVKPHISSILCRRHICNGSSSFLAL